MRKDYDATYHSISSHCNGCTPWLVGPLLPMSPLASVVTEEAYRLHKQVYVKLSQCRDMLRLRDVTHKTSAVVQTNIEGGKP
jgi:hypothetical protein